jgi:cobalt-zinc-cadmium resistance protein CzcA
MGSVVADMQGLVRRHVAVPPGYYVTWEGEFENQRRAMARLAVIIPISLFLIFALLFNAFKSAKNALLIMTNIPFALIGGVFALLATGIALSVSAAVGFIALFSQSVLSGIVMVSYFGQLREKGLNPHEAVVEGALGRLRMNLMIALLAILGLVPMALSHGIGSEVQKPLAVVIIGGLLTSTFLTLFVLPNMYLLFTRRREWEPEKLPG